MSSRDEILNRIRMAGVPEAPKPSLDVLKDAAMKYDDKSEQFASMLASVGGQCVSLDGRALNDVLAELIPAGARVASNMPGVECATFNPDDLSSPAELDGTDYAVVRGCFGVAENAAVWIEQDVRERAVYFIAETLVILLDRESLVNNMHEAYERLGDARQQFGVFISGPSKTADIEQALVFGAHGARGVIVVLC